jgi:hypothetical protein
MNGVIVHCIAIYGEDIRSQVQVFGDDGIKVQSEVTEDLVSFTVGALVVYGIVKVRDITEVQVISIDVLDR